MVRSRSMSRDSSAKAAIIVKKNVPSPVGGQVPASIPVMTPGDVFRQPVEGRRDDDRSKRRESGSDETVQHVTYPVDGEPPTMRPGTEV